MSNAVELSACPRTLYFPLAATGTAAGALCLMRRPDGHRVAIAFTTRRRLGVVVGDDCPWTCLCLSAAHEMLDPLGVDEVRVDPHLVLRAPTHGRAAG